MVLTTVMTMVMTITANDADDADADNSDDNGDEHHRYPSRSQHWTTLPDYQLEASEDQNNLPPQQHLFRLKYHA